MRILLTLGLTVGMACEQPTHPPSEVVPPPSAGHALVYHEGLQRVLLLNAGLGGMDDASRIGKPTRIWSWNGDAWALIDSTGPAIRNLGGVVYDSKRQVVVFFGGTASQSLNYGDTWEWSSTTGWTKRTDSGPGIRSHFQMSYDPVRGRTVLFGGNDASTTLLSDTWEWDGSTWTKITATGPAARVHHAMAYDAASQRVIVVAGGGQGGDFSDAWSWNGTAWSQIGAADDRTHALLARSDAAGTLALISGMPDRPMTVLEGTAWRSLGGSKGLSARYLSAAAFDAKR